MKQDSNITEQAKIDRGAHGILKILAVRNYRIREGEKEAEKDVRFDKLLDVLPEEKIKEHLINTKVPHGEGKKIDNPFQTDEDTIAKAISKLKSLNFIAEKSSNPARYRITDMGYQELNKLEPEPKTKWVDVGARRMGVKREGRE